VSCDFVDWSRYTSYCLWRIFCRLNYIKLKIPKLILKHSKQCGKFSQIKTAILYRIKNVSSVKIYNKKKIFTGQHIV